MRWHLKLPLRLRSIFDKAGLDRELDEELRYHLERQIEENVAAGMAPEEARRAALAELGGTEAHKEECRDARRVTWVHDLARDLRFGLRMFSKSPGFTAVAVLILALGIGATTAIASFVDAMLLRALPVRAPDELVVLGWKAHNDPKTYQISSYGDCNGFEAASWTRMPADGPGSAGCSFSLPYLQELRAEKDLFAGLVAFASAPSLLLTGAGSPAMASGQLVSGSYFEVLGVRPALGRMLGPDDETQASRVVVLAYATWQNVFGGDPNVVGRSVELNGTAFTIVGVADAGYTRLTPGNVYDLWLPLSVRRTLEPTWDARMEGPGSWYLTIVARLRPGVPAAELAGAANRLFQRDVVPGLFAADDEPELSVSPAPSRLTGSRVRFKKQLTVLTIAVAIVLAIACANVAGLLLSRAGSRRREMAVRLAMGARRGRVIRQLLAESVLLAIAGGALGSLFAVWGVQAMAAFLAENQTRPLGFDIAVDGRVLVFTLAVSLVVGLVFGLAPAFRGSRVDLAAALRGETVAVGRPRLGKVLVMAQVALSVLVLVGAGLLCRTLEKLRAVDLGFRAENVLLFSIDPTLAGEKDEAIDVLYQRIRDDLLQLPGVTSVTWSNVRPLSANLMVATLRLLGSRPSETLQVDYMATGPSFFDTLGVGLVAGRTLSVRDVTDAAAAQAAAKRAQPKAPTRFVMAAVVNEAFARKYFSGKSPIGERFQQQGDEPSATWEIVGVVRDMKYDEPRREIMPTVYVTTAGDGVSFEVRTAVDPMALVPGIRAAVARLAPRLPVVDVKTQVDEVERVLFTERLMARFSILFGALALGLACIGLYALLSYEVSQRAREVGIRMALGARHGDVRRLVVKEGLVLALAGIVVGTVAALGVTRFLAGMLYGVPPTDPVVLAGVPVLLVAVAALACYLPARRATRVDPMVVLRAG